MLLQDPGTALAPRADHPDPLWVQAVDLVVSEIASGRLTPGMRLPPERELCARLGISRVTLRKALGYLVEGGVLNSSHGRGWYVAGVATRDWPNDLESFSETADRMGLSASSRILRAATAPASIDEAEQLSIAPGTSLFHLERVRLLDDVPIALDESHLPASLVPGHEMIDFRRASLYTELSASGLDHAETTIEASAADQYLATHLDIQVGAPVLVMRQVVVDTSGRPVFASVIRYAGDRYRLRTTFTRHRSAD